MFNKYNNKVFRIQFFWNYHWNKNYWGYCWKNWKKYILF